jgi:hypothetical protein
MSTSHLGGDGRMGGRRRDDPGGRVGRPWRHSRGSQSPIRDAALARAVLSVAQINLRVSESSAGNGSLTESTATLLPGG